MSATEEQLIGRIVCVSGSQIITLLDESVRANGRGTPEALQKGRMVKMQTAESTVYGMINGLSVPTPSQDLEQSETQILELEVLGEIANHGENGRAGFQRGVSVFPALGDAVFATTREDLSQVYVRAGDKAVRIGSLYQDHSLPASIVPNDLLGKHFAVLGTTGSGKSCAVALVLHAILEQHSNAHVVLLDPHSEYAAAFGDLAEVLTPQTLELPYWLLNFEEIEEIILGRDVNADGREVASIILRDLIGQAKKKYNSREDAPGSITADTPVPYGLSELASLIDEKSGKLEKGDQTAPYLRLKSRIQALREDARFNFIFGGIAVRDNMARILSRIFRVPVEQKPITIVDLSSVPSEILNVVVSILGRLTFDFALWSDRAVPILLVCEEAHRYAPQDTTAGFEPAKRALARIAKEGRKYGVSLCVVSQRPSELAAEVLSQCNTIFALRMSSNKDQEFVRGAMSDTASGLLDFLPSLRNAEAIAVGEGLSVPLRLNFDSLPADKRPLSGTAAFSAAWQEDNQTIEFVQAVVDRWRHQKK